MSCFWEHRVLNIWIKPLRPQANAQVECQNCSLLESLCIAYMYLKWKNWWTEFVTCAWLVVYQFTPRATTGAMPLYLMFGQERRTKLLELSRETIEVTREDVCNWGWLNKLKAKPIQMHIDVQCLSPYRLVGLCYWKQKSQTSFQQHVISDFQSGSKDWKRSNSQKRGWRGIQTKYYFCKEVRASKHMVCPDLDHKEKKIAHWIKLERGRKLSHKLGQECLETFRYLQFRVPRKREKKLKVKYWKESQEACAFWRLFYR